MWPHYTHPSCYPCPFLTHTYEDHTLHDAPVDISENFQQVQRWHMAGNSINGISSSSIDFLNRFNASMNGVIDTRNEKPSASGDLSFFQFETTGNEGLFGDRPLCKWVGRGESADLQVGGSSLNPVEDEDDPSPLLDQWAELL
ncbi:hypothetical protein PVL29_022903 [Vitis rotundifolia]|uniref:Uncharacterized protein n=1 Tax=Vitis rotundifolia TaxID=103349 RepID=A0AA38YX47_VITRO|nr:hypothetical protein PVL29_022903 [Vitis rotundifolia]